MPNQTEKLRYLIQTSPLSAEAKDFWFVALPMLNEEEIQKLSITLREASEELAIIK